MMIILFILCAESLDDKENDVSEYFIPWAYGLFEHVTSQITRKGHMCGNTLYAYMAT